MPSESAQGVSLMVSPSAPGGSGPARTLSALLKALAELKFSPLLAETGNGREVGSERGV